MKPKLLIVDDDEEIRTQMRWALASDYEVLLAYDRDGALASFNAERPSVVILDLGLPPHPNQPDEGMVTITDLLAVDQAAKIIIISGQEEKENALRAIGSGAYDFFSKPVNVEELKLLLDAVSLSHDSKKSTANFNKASESAALRACSA